LGHFNIYFGHIKKIKSLSVEICALRLDFSSDKITINGIRSKCFDVNRTNLNNQLVYGVISLSSLLIDLPLKKYSPNQQQTSNHKYDPKNWKQTN